MDDRKVSANGEKSNYDVGKPEQDHIENEDEQMTSLEAKGEGDSDLLKASDENLDSTDRSQEKGSQTLSKDFSLNGDSKPFQSEDSTAPLTRPNISGGRVNGSQHGIVGASDVEGGTFQDIADSELAVAIAIDEDEDETELKKLVSVHAVEYDPDSNPPIYKNRRVRLYGFGGCCVFIIALVVLVSVSVVKKNSASSNNIYIYLTNEPTEAPTEAPTNARENVYRSYFAAEVSPLVFEQGTPLYKASNWILYEDPQQLGIDDPRLLQR